MPLEEGKTMNQGRPRGMTSDVTTTGDEEKSTWQLKNLQHVYRISQDRREFGMEHTPI